MSVRDSYTKTRAQLHNNGSIMSRPSEDIITYKILNGLALKNLANFLVLHQPNANRRLRSNATENLRLHWPVFRTKNYGGRAFHLVHARFGMTFS